MAAPALSTARSRRGPASPARIARVVAAFSSGVPPATASGAAAPRPTSPGSTPYRSMLWPLTSTTWVRPPVLISSSPSSLDTTSALSTPSCASAPAIVSRKAGSATPTSWRVAPAGLVSGPRKLKIVRTANSRRTGTTKRVAWWWTGANMKPKPTSRTQSATASVGGEGGGRPDPPQRGAGAAPARGRAVAVLGHGASGARRDQGRGRGDVERRAPAARPGRVEQVVAARGAPRGAGAEPP